jgi:anti-anti-sigma factor
MTVTIAQPPKRELPAPVTLGLATREAFRRSANELLDELAEGDGQLVVDFSGTKEVDSSGLGALVMVQRHAADRRQQVVLRAVSAELEFLLVLTKLDDLFLFEQRRGER